MNSIKSIENNASRARSLINDNKLPVDLNKIAKKLGVEIIKHDLGDNVSGVLYIDKGQGIIGYNPNESRVRQRFTIAHELGHYVLHRLNKELFVSHKSSKLFFRNDKSKTGEYKLEREANAFAAALLMPKEILIEEFNRVTYNLNIDEEDVINELAKKFKVSTLAMTYRIANLNLF